VDKASPIKHIGRLDGLRRGSSRPISRPAPHLSASRRGALPPKCQETPLNCHQPAFCPQTIHKADQAAPALYGPEKGPERPARAS